MSFKNETIRNIIEDIESKKVFLPAIQRRFVWKIEKIENLFDSIIKNYPIGTFLFWELKKEKARDYVFYQFLEEYDERKPYNKKKEGAFLKDEIVGILDGQQRLSSLYIGLQGTYSHKLKYKRKDSDDAYPKKILYVNLLSLPYKEDIHSGKIEIETEENFQFKFLTDNESITMRNDDVFTVWFKVGDVLEWGIDPDIDDIYDKIKDKISDQEVAKEFISNKRYIKKFLRDFHKRIWLDELINYFSIKKDDLEYVLEIFIRVNSGATILTKTDLMFSTIIATWEDGRDKIEELIKLLNNKGEGFDFNNDFLMRSCLVLCDLPVLFKVNSFKSDNVEYIRDNWKKIAEALSKTVDMLVSLGFNGSRLTSNNAIIIIAYYFMKGGSDDRASKEGIKKYLLHALLNNIYGGQGDQVISSLRSVLRVESGSKGQFKLKSNRFPSGYFSDVKLPSNKTLKINIEDVENFLMYKKGASAFHLLLLLYPNLKFTEVNFHQDHIHPDSGFKKSKLHSIGIKDEEKIKDWLNKKDTLPNLQLMEGIQNTSKNSKPFIEWFNNNVDDKEKFCKDNYIPCQDQVSYEFSNFEEFYEARKRLIKNRLLEVLDVRETSIERNGEI